MKTTAVLTLCLASASAFTPSTNGVRAPTQLAAKKDAAEPAKKSLFTTIFEMDLFAPNKAVNDYGARSKKPVSCYRHGVVIRVLGIRLIDWHFID